MNVPYDKSFAIHINAKYWSEKNMLKPEQVYMCSGKSFIFKCNVCNHEFSMSLIKIVNGRWCSYCSNTLLCDDNNCNTCYLKSFSSSMHYSELIDKTINPRKIFKHSNKKYLFKCKDCSHIIEKSLNKVSIDVWCKYCTNQELCNDNECKSCFNKSFSSSIHMNIWSMNNNANPRDLFKFSHSKYLFICKNCNHEYSCALSNINIRGCSYCSSKKMCTDNLCMICFNKSLASLKDIGCKWSSKNNLSSRSIFKNSNKKYIFDCNYCNNEFTSTPNNISHYRRCPKCKNKTELTVYNFLKDKFNMRAQINYDWCKNPKTNRYLPFDLECNERILIEIDGLQHFKQVWCWKSPEEQLILDKYKNECAIYNNKHIIRIFQEDVYYNRNNWDTNLLSAINELLNTNETKIKFIGNIYNRLNTPH